jgi:nucleotide-binding universal stress UspA family protein
MYKEILLPIDLNSIDSQGKAVETAIGLAQAFGSRVHVQTIVPDFGLPLVASYFPEGFESKALENANQALHDFVKRSFPPDVTVQHIVSHGSIYQEILHCAKEVGAELIVMASHRPDIEDYLIGPNASRVTRHADCSVLVVRD